MTRTFWAALHNEFSKYARQKFPYLGLIAVVLLAGLWVKSFPLITDIRRTNAFVVVVLGTIAATTSIFPVFSVIFASALVASETANGTYRNVLARPISRVEFLTAKIAFACAYALLLVALHLVTVFAMATAQFTFGPVVDEGIVVASTGEVIGAFSIAVLLTLVPLFALVCFGIMISTLSKSLTNALGISIGLLIAIEPIKVFVHWGNWQMKDYVVSTYLDKALVVAKNAAEGFSYQWLPSGWWRSDLSWGLMLSVATAAVFLFVSYYTFLRRDLNFS
jgi:ABC-type transport system involved in multi-copper enzyme maturation permease subunit